MSIYETVFMVKPELSATAVQSLSDTLTALLKEQGGTILKTENWGLRTLAYRIQKSRKAHYVLIEHESSAAALHETERQMRLNEDIMRYLTIKLDAASTTPSAILNKDYDRDTRSDKIDDIEKEVA